MHMGNSSGKPSSSQFPIKGKHALRDLEGKRLDQAKVHLRISILRVAARMDPPRKRRCSAFAFVLFRALISLCINDFK